MLAVEDAKNTGRLQNTELEVMGRAAEALRKMGYDERQVDLKFDPVNGKALVTRNGQLFEYVPGVQTDMGMSDSGFRPVKLPPQP